MGRAPASSTFLLAVLCACRTEGGARPAVVSKEHSAPLSVATDRSSVTVAAVLRDSLCAVPSNAYECDQAVERVLLLDPAVRAHRTGNVLTISLDSAKDVTFQSDSVVGYSYGGYLPELRSHLIAVQYDEAYDWLVVSNRTGKPTHLQGIPQASPDSSRFLIVPEEGPETWVGHACLEVFKLEADSASLEWTWGRARSDGGCGPSAWPPRTLSWRSADSIVALVAAGLEAQSRLDTLVFVRGPRGWAPATRAP
jgi:hypothetical protein